MAGRASCCERPAIAHRSSYNGRVARGWESKFIDDQQAEAEAAKVARDRTVPDAGDRERQVQRETLLLNRARTLQSLQVACDPRYRTLLEQTLAHLDNELAALDGP